MPGCRVPGNVRKSNEQRSCRSLTRNCDITCVLINRRFNKKLSNHEENQDVFYFTPVPSILLILLYIAILYLLLLFYLKDKYM